ncbi:MULTISPECIES: hypothetical protein [Moorena]|uniref:hypothetical protein n=1 Tax=Moorena TaxID=1155738 RepID=UPI00117F5364|nr:MULTISPECIES: hypothetical protein [Moorena]NES40934.1 hypothetical protein [Moorena sp. SIO2C4]NET66698.1 hypothetical protein [Moorena sp. SIO1G6]
MAKRPPYANNLQLRSPRVSQRPASPRVIGVWVCVWAKFEIDINGTNPITKEHKTISIVILTGCCHCVVTT